LDNSRWLPKVIYDKESWRNRGFDIKDGAAVAARQKRLSGGNMAPKRALYYSYGEDEKCAATRKYMEESGVILQSRDLSKNPLSERELTMLLGHLKLDHFLNSSSPGYIENKLDSTQPDRSEVIKMMVADHTMIRRPIVKVGRLVIVGCDQSKISEMLQIGNNGLEPQKDPPQPAKHGRYKKSHAGRS
jgi:arsenate reductase-like glutaredoxin family protein